MSDKPSDHVQAAADDVMAMAEEVEASGEATMGGERLARARAILHDWVDTVTAVVAVPAFGRVTLIHENGQQSTISTRELPFTISAPVEWNKER